MKEIDQLIALSRKYGSNPDFVIAGGGNSSFKTADRLWVKASGVAMADIDEEGFAVLNRSLLKTMEEKTYSSLSAEREAQVKKELAAACLSEGCRPSVETSLHNCIRKAFVMHTHPTLVNALMCSVKAESICRNLFPEALYIEYTDPGYTLFKKVLDRIADYRNNKGKKPSIIFLQNHGVFVGGDSPEEIDRIYDTIITKLKTRVTELPKGEGSVNDEVLDVLPALRSILSRKGRGLKTLKLTCNAVAEEAMESLSSPILPLTPDMIVYCKAEYIHIEGEDRFTEAERKIEEYIARRGYSPRVLLIKGIGIVTVGDTAREAERAGEVFMDAMKVSLYARDFGGVHAMERAWIDFIENWEAESYRQKVASSAAEGRVKGKTIVVTGAAQGFGEGIARELVKEGANVVVADLNELAGERTVEGLNVLTQGNKAIFVKTDVSKMESVQNLVRECVCNFGALDVFVSNAGIARAGGLEQLAPETFDLVTRINYHAFFYCSRAACHVMKILTRYDPDYWTDIIQINSKSGLEGSKANYAYAGSKFGGIGLVQSFALELAPYNIKVNAICPGNFLDGPLWSDPEKGLFIQYLNAGKVPGARSVEDVREYYLSKVPMHKGCSPHDVTKAILYSIDQTGETGQAIPVTGGQVMLS